MGRYLEELVVPYNHQYKEIDKALECPVDHDQRIVALESRL